MMNNDQSKYNNVGYSISNSNVNALFSEETLVYLHNKLLQLLQGIVVPIDIIKHVLDAVYASFIPSSGNIYSRYTVMSNENDNHIDAILNQTLQIIVTQVTADMRTMERNSKLSAWNRILGESNPHGLRAHSQIKLNRKRPQQMLFNNMTY